MIDFKKLKPNMKIKFNVTEGDFDTFWHFSTDGEYIIRTMQSAYPSKPMDDPDRLIIWCDEIDIHLVSDLTATEWDVVTE